MAAAIVGPIAAQGTERIDPDKRRERTAMSTRAEADEPGEMDALTRESRARQFASQSDMRRCPVRLHASK
jgi:hypothetical protein